MFYSFFKIAFLSFRLRLRKKIGKRPGTLFLDDELFGTDVFVNTMTELFIEILDGILRILITFFRRKIYRLNSIEKKFIWKSINLLEVQFFLVGVRIFSRERQNFSRKNIIREIRIFLYEIQIHLLQIFN